MKKDLIISYILTCHEEEAKENAEAVALEQSVELPKGAVNDQKVADLSIPDIYEFIPLRKLSGGLTQFRLRLAYSPSLVGEDIPQFFNLLFGNISLKEGILVEDAELPDEILSLFPGPANGIKGIRDICKMPSGALLCSVLKPLGSPAYDLAEMAGEFIKAGVHFIKDDHNLTDQTISPFIERVKAIQKLIKRLNSKSIYLPNITGSFEDIEKKITIGLNEGIKGFLVSPFLIGLDIFRYLRKKYPLLWMAHPSFSGAFFTDKSNGIKPGFLLGKIQRLLGADMVIYPDSGGRFFIFNKDECREIAANLREGFEERFKPSMPVPAGGISISDVAKVLSFYGNDVMLLIGGSVFLHKDGLQQATRQLLELISQTVQENIPKHENINPYPLARKKLKGEDGFTEKKHDMPKQSLKAGVTSQIGEGIWEGLQKGIYKPEGYNFSHVLRTELYVPSEGEAGFDVRYFEIEQGGYSSFERHKHIHFVIGVRGRGELRINEEWQTLTPNSIALIPQNCPHQLRNNNKDVFGFYCIVDHERDEPVELGNRISQNQGLKP